MNNQQAEKQSYEEGLTDGSNRQSPTSDCTHYMRGWRAGKSQRGGTRHV